MSTGPNIRARWHIFTGAGGESRLNQHRAAKPAFCWLNVAVGVNADESPRVARDRRRLDAGDGH